MILKRNKRKEIIIRRRIIFFALIAIIFFIIVFFAYTNIKKISLNDIKSNTEASTQVNNSTSIYNNINKTELGNVSSPYNGYNASEIVKGQNIIKSAESYAVPANEVAQILAGHSDLKTKEVFLTFDDGPSENTEKILQILRENNVHATFFILGKQLQNNEKNQQLVREEISQGNAIGNHSLTHDYKILYPNNKLDVSAVMKEIDTTSALLNEILGNNFYCGVLRLPGGYMSRSYYKDPNLVDLNKALDDQCITSIDWDAQTGDAASTKSMSIQTLVNNAMGSVKKLNQPVILMHDAAAKKETVEALPYLIKELKDQGYTFKVIENAPKSSFENIPYETTTGSNQGQGTLS